MKRHLFRRRRLAIFDFRVASYADAGRGRQRRSALRPLLLLGALTVVIGFGLYGWAA